MPPNWDVLFSCFITCVMLGKGPVVNYRVQREWSRFSWPLHLAVFSSVVQGAGCSALVSTPRCAPVQCSEVSPVDSRSLGRYSTSSVEST